MSPQPGEVWLADLGLAAKTRPVAIVSRQDFNPQRALVLYVPLTTQNRFSPYEIPLPRFPFLHRDSVANVQGLASIPAVRLERKLGRLPRDVMAKLKSALADDRGRNNAAARGKNAPTNGGMAAWKATLRCCDEAQPRKNRRGARRN